VKKIPLHDRINQFPGQHLSVIGNKSIFCTACKEVVSSKKSILSPHSAMMMMMMMINFINVSRPHSLGKSHTNLGTQWPCHCIL